MIRMMIDTDALIATFNAHDDEYDLDSFELIHLLATHIKETEGEMEAAEFAFSYDACPIHFCDIEICDDDENEECQIIRGKMKKENETS